MRNIRKLFKRQRMGLLRGNLHAVDGAVDLLCNHRADVMAVIRGVVDFVRTRTVACHHPSDLIHVLAEGLVLNGFQQPLSEQRRYIRWGDSLILHRGLNAAHAMQDTALIVDRKTDAVLVCDGSRSVRILNPIRTIAAGHSRTGRFVVQEIKAPCTGYFVVYAVAVIPFRPDGSSVFLTAARRISGIISRNSVILPVIVPDCLVRINELGRIASIRIDTGDFIRTAACDNAVSDAQTRRSIPACADSGVAFFQISCKISPMPRVFSLMDFKKSL